MNKRRSGVSSPSYCVGWCLPVYAFAKIRSIHVKKTPSTLNQEDAGSISDIIHISSACLALPLRGAHSPLVAWPGESTPQRPSEASSAGQRQGWVELVPAPWDISSSLLSEPILYFLQKSVLQVDPGSPHFTNGLFRAHATDCSFIHQKVGWKQLVVDFRKWGKVYAASALGSQLVWKLRETPGNSLCL